MQTDHPLIRPVIRRGLGACFAAALVFGAAACGDDDDAVEVDGEELQEDIGEGAEDLGEDIDEGTDELQEELEDDDGGEED